MRLVKENDPIHMGTTIEDLWKKYYLHKYTGIPLSPDEIMEAKQAFFSGAYSFLTTMYVLANKPNIDKDAPNWLIDRKEEMEKTFDEWYKLGKGA